MWKYGYKLSSNTQAMGAMMVDVDLAFQFNAWDLFRKCEGKAKATIYIKDKNKKRHVVCTLSAVSGMTYAHEHIALSPNEELYVAFEGVKLKANSFILNFVGVLEHYTDKNAKDQEKKSVITRSLKPVPVDVFNHDWRG